jgi:hypothetical protein
MDKEKEAIVTPSQMLSDALFMSRKLIHLIIVGEDEDGSIIIWRSNDTTMHAVGMLEAAKLQTLGVTGSDDEPSAREEEDADHR